VGLPPGSPDELDEIWDFVGADSVHAADRLIAQILGRIRDLTSLPNQGHKRTDLTARPLRFIRVHEYLIALRAARKAALGCRHRARTPQPAGPGRHPPQLRVTHLHNPYNDPRCSTPKI
jgi:plasmid stabilization system protein ParE